MGEQTTRLRIVLFSASYAPKIGGLETAVARLAQEFSAQGHHVTVITNRYPRHLARYERLAGISVYRLLFPVPPLVGAQGGVRERLKRAFLAPLAPLVLLRLHRLLRQLEPDIINVHYLSTPALYITALTALRQMRCPVVLSCHGSDVTAPPYPAGSEAAARWVLQHAAAATACSANLATHMQRLTTGTPLAEKPLHVVFNGCDSTEFDVVAPHLHPRLYIFGAGRLYRKKGFDLLIEALATLRAGGLDIDLILAGTGPEEAMLKSQAREAGLDTQVTFVGAARREMLGALYKGAAVVVIPSRREGLGIVALEAMSCARPVVAAHAGGLPEIVADGETGLLFAAGSSSDLAAKIAQVLEDNVLGSRLGTMGRERVSAHFSWPVVTQRYLAAYLEALSGSETELEHKVGRQHSGWVDPVSSVPILMYHQVAPPQPDGVKPSLLVRPEQFAAQMRLLRLLGWRSIGLGDLVTAFDSRTKLPPRSFVLTFDDAFKGVIEHAAPVLRRHGFTATVFAATSLLGTNVAMDGGNDSPFKAVMTWEDLSTLQAAGWEIGAHSCNHRRLTTLSTEQLRAEVWLSGQAVTQRLGRLCDLFAYPFGDWNDEIARVVKEAGYRAACGTEFGRSSPHSSLLALPRISISADLDLAHFAYRLLCAGRIERRAGRQGRSPRAAEMRP